MLITINAQKKDVQATHLTYQEIVDMADSGRSKQALHSITYSVRGTGDKQGWERSGLISPGQTLELADGMHISAMVTDNA
jgi:hypothetical protein